MRGLGQGVKEFKKGMKDCDNFIDKDEEVKKSNDESTPPLSTNTNAQDNEQKK